MDEAPQVIEAAASIKDEPTYNLQVPSRLWPIVQLANAGYPVSRSLLGFIAKEPDQEKRLILMGEVWRICELVMKKAVRQDRQDNPVQTRAERRHHKKS